MGLGLGLPLLAAIVALALLWRSSRKRTSSPAHEGVLMVPEERPTRGKGYGASEIAGQQLQEMDGLGANR